MSVTIGLLGVLAGGLFGLWLGFFVAKKSEKAPPSPHPKRYTFVRRLPPRRREQSKTDALLALMYDIGAQP